MARHCGLGNLLEPAHVSSTLDSILRFNRRNEFHSHFNNMRSFALGDESALLMASYPRGDRLRRPFPYFTEVMTGFEHVVASHLLWEGRTEEAVQIVADIRSRYDGRKRNPFDEAECGHHYARAMAAWSHVAAAAGFAYSAVSQSLRFNRPDTLRHWFWAGAGAWGIVTLSPTREGGTHLELQVREGELKLRSIALQDGGRCQWNEVRRVSKLAPLEVML
jgi:hypothetical protein